MRNNTNYGETGVLTALQYTSQFPKIILENFYVKSRNSVETGRKETVAGYVIPAGQRDMTRVERLVNLLRLQGIEIGRATGGGQAARKAPSPPARSSSNAISRTAGWRRRCSRSRSIRIPTCAPTTTRRGRWG